ncbi:MAG: hypothetical protein ACI9YU_001038 [Flavobacteriales bacterium]
MKNELSNELLELETNPRQPHHLLRVMEKKIAYAIIAGLWIYIALRALLVPFTHDEAATFFHYIQPQEWIPGQAHWDANNHILNSGLSIISYQLFGSAPWALRLPNVFAGLLYLIVTWKLAQNVGDRTSRWALFITLACTSFLLEFFGFCRGYGLSMAFFLLAIWGYSSWIRKRELGKLLVCLLSIALMMLSNMSLLISALILCALVVVQILKIQERLTAQLILASFFSIGGLYLAIEYSFNLKERGLLYYGQGNYFWDVTLASLAEFSFYPLGEWMIWMFPTVFAIILVLAFRLLRTGIHSFLNHKAALPVLLLFGNVAAHIGMKLILDVNYPEDRVALMYLPLLALSAFYLERKSSGITIILMIYAVVFPLQLLANINLQYSVLWNKDHALHPFYQLAQTIDSQTEKAPTTEGYRLRNITYDYNNHLNNGRLSGMRAYSDNGYLADLVITENGMNYDLSDYEMLVYDPVSNLGTYRRSEPWKKVAIAEGSFNSQGETDAQFKELVNIPIPEDKPVGYLFVPELCLHAKEQSPRLSLVGQVSNAEHKAIDNHEVALDRLKPIWSDSTCVLDHSLLIDTRFQESKHLKVFLWNRENQGSYSATGSWKLYELR